jgi:hypothetical protein
MNSSVLLNALAVSDSLKALIAGTEFPKTERHFLYAFFCPSAF